MGNKVRIIMFFVFMGMLSLLIPYSIFLKERNLQKNRDVLEEVMGLEDISGYPSLAQIPPNEAFAGEAYQYDLKIVDKDSDEEDIVIGLQQAPDWLFYDNKSIFGVPSEDDLGSSLVRISVSDGENTIYKSFYIVVSENEN